MNRKHIDISSSTLHILAMALMLCDHIWATLLGRYEWLTCVGRIAFPIFAFMLVEGFYHTKNVYKYCLRLLIGALISEVPFDLIYCNTAFYPFHQNVLWTFLISLLLMILLDRIRKKYNRVLAIIFSILITILGFAIGMVTMVDYYGMGILTVLSFYFFYGRKWWCLAGQIISLYILNVQILGGYYYPVTILGHEFEIIQQGFALFALIPIWLYCGRQGYHSKVFQYFCYGFYPGHLIILYIIYRILY